MTNKFNSGTAALPEDGAKAKKAKAPAKPKRNPDDMEVILTSRDIVFTSRMSNVDKCYDTIMELHGEEEFKEMVKRLHVFQQNSAKFTMPNMVLPNFLWVAPRGSGVSTRLSALVEYLHAARIMEFSGKMKYFEFTPGYIEPGLDFTELTRLNYAILEMAGFHRYYRGLVCIVLDEWARHTEESHFAELLNYLAVMNDTILTVFCVHTDDRRLIENVESAISSHMRLETITTVFPKAEELVSIMDERYISINGFTLTADARELLCDAIGDIATSTRFYGYVTIRQIANDILYNILTTELSDSRITGDMLAAFKKGSPYMQKLKERGGVNPTNTIGFLSTEAFTK